MRANDELNPAIPSEGLGTASESTKQLADAEDNHSWMDEPLNFTPLKPGKTIEVNCVQGGRIPPLPHPGIWDDDDELEPIDVHTLNVAPWKIQFSVPGTVVLGEPWQPLPYPDPLEGRDEEVDD